MKKKPLVTELTESQIAILASYVFCPYPYRRRGPEIAKTVPIFFNKLYKIGKYRTPATLGRLGLSVTRDCQHLVKLGYLTNERPKKVMYVSTKGREHPYESPTFALSESGFAFVLSYCDHTCLIKLKSGPNVSYTERIYGYEHVSVRVTQEFAGFIRSNLLEDI